MLEDFQGDSWGLIPPLRMSSLLPHDLCHGWSASCRPPTDFPGKNTGVGSHFLLQGIFPAQGSNPGLLHCRQILYWLSYQGSIAKAHITTSALYVTEPIDGHLDCFHFFYYYELYCYEHAHTSLCVYVCFHFSSICTKGRKCWVFYVTSSFFQYLFLFIWLYRVFAVAWKLLVEACGSSSLTRDIIRAPCIGNAES